MIGTMGRSTAKETSDLCPRGFGRQFSLGSRDVVVASGSHITSVAISRRPLGTNEASRVSIALCEGGEFHILNCWPIPSKTRHVVLRGTGFVHKEYKDYVKFIHSSGGAGGEQKHI